MAKGSRKKGRSRHGGGPKTTNDAAQSVPNTGTEEKVDVSEQDVEAAAGQNANLPPVEAQEGHSTNENGTTTDAVPNADEASPAPSPAPAPANDEEVIEWKRRCEEMHVELEEAKTMVNVLSEAKEKAEGESLAEREKQSIMHQQLLEAAEVQETMTMRAKEWEEVRNTLLEEMAAVKKQLSEVEANYEKTQQSEVSAIEDATCARAELQEALDLQKELKLKCEMEEGIKQKCQQLKQDQDALQQQLEEEKRLSAVQLTELEKAQRSEASLQSQKAVIEHEAQKRQASLESELESERKIRQDQERHLTELKDALATKESELQQVHEEKEDVAAALKMQQEAEHTHQGEQDALRNKLRAAIRKGKRIEEEKQGLEAHVADLSANTEALSSQLDDLKAQIRAWEERHQQFEEQRTKLEEDLLKERQIGEERQLALIEVEGAFEAFKRESQMQLGEMEEIKKEAAETESGIRQKLQAAIKKGMRIDGEKQRLEQQMVELGEVVAGVMQKVPEISVLKHRVTQLSAELSSMENDLQRSINEGAHNRSEVLRLKKEIEALQMERSEAEAAQNLLQTQLQEMLDSHTRTDMQFEEALQKIRALDKEKEDMKNHTAELESVISGNEAKLVRAREAIETLRKERSLLAEKHAALVQETQSLRSENEVLLQQQDNTENTDLQQKLIEIEKAHRLTQKRLTDATEQILTAEEAKQKLEEQLAALQEELQTSSDPPTLTADIQVILITDMEARTDCSLCYEVVEAVYQTAATVAQQLNLPFMEPASVNGDAANAQLQAIQVLLEGTSVGIKKTQEQLAYLPTVMSELESSKATVRHLEEELVNLKKEAVTPASSSTVELPTSVSTPYSQTKGIKRRELQDPTDTHIIDLGNSSVDDEPESKAGEYTPLISIQAFRSAPPPVLHFMQSVDRQTQGAGRLLGHRPIARVGVLTYAVALHIILLILIV